MYINHSTPRKGQDSDSLGRLHNLRLDNAATVGNYNILVVAIDQLHSFREEAGYRTDGVRTARTKPQLATGPQKWVVLGPTGLFTNALNAVAMPANLNTKSHQCLSDLDRCSREYGWKFQQDGGIPLSIGLGEQIHPPGKTGRGRDADTSGGFIDGGVSERKPDRRRRRA